MKLTVTISEQEERGIRAYLKEVGEINNPKKEDIRQFIQSFIDIINAPQEAVSYYIKNAQ